MKRGNSATIVLAATVAALASSSALAATKVWKDNAPPPASMHDWGVTTNWAPTGVPGAGATAEFVISAYNPVNLNVDTAALGGLQVDIGANPVISTTTGKILNFDATSTIDVYNGSVLTVGTKIGLATGGILTKTGGGAVQLTPVTGSSTFLGTMKINGGNVNLSGRNLNTPVADTVNIDVGDAGSFGTFSGNGAIGNISGNRFGALTGNASVVVGSQGEITPYDRVDGALVSSMTINGRLTLKGGSEYHVYVGDQSSGSIINVLSIDQQGITTVNVDGLPGFDPLLSADWQIMASTKQNVVIDASKFVIGAIGGTATGNASNYTIWNVTAPGGGYAANTLYLHYAAVPEAGTMLLGGCALMPLLSYRRRAKKA